MSWLASPPNVAKAVKSASKKADGAAAARRILAHRGTWTVGVGLARRGTLGHCGAASNGGARGIVGGSAGPTQGRLLLPSQWMVREARARLALQGAQIVYKEAQVAAQVAARRFYMRLISQLCGVSVGMGIVCVAVSALDRWTLPQVSEARLPLAGTDCASLTRTSSGPLLDLLTRNLVRKNSRLAIEEAYTFASGAPLGVGSFGVVQRATHNRTGLERAVKKIDKQGIADLTMLSREVEALRVMDHPNICRLIEYFETDRHLWLVMELCRGEELCDRVLSLPRGLPEAEAAPLMAQMLRATLHCHGRAVLHRDLKPENFLFKDAASSRGDELKLVDFGFCMPAPATSSSSSSSPSKASFFANLPGYPTSAGSAGTLLYRSPESFKGAAPSRCDDAWSLGVIFHILLTGQFPFSTNDDNCFQELCNRGKLQKDVEAHLQSLSLSASSSAADLVARLLAIDPAKRISIEAALRHPFIAEALGSSVAVDQWLEAEQVYSRCESFLRSPRLRRIAAATAARLLIDDTSGNGRHADSARAAFSALDKRGEGRIAPSDLRDFFIASGSFVPPHSWFASLASGWPALAEPQGIGYTAFVATTLDDVLVSGDDRLSRSVFDMLDAGQDGALSAKDLQLRLGLSIHEADVVVSEALGQLGNAGGVDAARKQELTFQDFLSLMRTVPTLPAQNARLKETPTPAATTRYTSTGSIRFSTPPAQLGVC